MGEAHEAGGQGAAPAPTARGDGKITGMSNSGEKHGVKVTIRPAVPEDAAAARGRFDGARRP